MHKVEEAVRRQTGKQARRNEVCAGAFTFSRHELVPANLGDLAAVAFRNANDAARQERKAAHTGTLFALLEQKLLSEADSKEGNISVHCFVNDFNEAA